ncbi:MAG: hypothetical protein ACI4OP_01185 [Candidatus Coprovivens sp.]
MLKIALDIDQTIADFLNPYYNRFGYTNKDYKITKNVFRILRHDRKFWVNLPVIERINFDPILYCTKRVNNKNWTKEWLRVNNLPIKPIYQMYYQHGNKADMIKGRCDVLIDDSISNVEKAIQSGLPSLLIDRPHNRNVYSKYRIYHLDINEIEQAYESLFLGWI